MNKFMRKYNKYIVAAMALLMIVMGLMSAVYASGVDELYNKEINKGSISSQITVGGDSQSATEILEKIDTQVSNIVATVRVIATIGAVIFVIWLGIIFFTSGSNTQKIFQAKAQVAMFFLSLVLIFMAEPIVRFILSWFM